MPKNILVTDLVKELEIEKKVLSKYKIKLKNILKLNKKDLKEINGIITGHTIDFNKELLSKLINCKIIVRYGAGYNNINVIEARKLGIKIFNVPDYGVNEVADHAIAMTMMFLKNINEYYFRILNKKKNFWNYKGGFFFRRLSKINTGVIGLGRIGRAYARKANSLGMNVFYYDPYVKQKNTVYKKINSLEKIFQTCQVISLHVPISKETKFFINSKTLNKVKNNIILINTSRGELIKNNTLIRFLNNKKILCLGVDVLENEPISFNEKLFKMAKNKSFTSRILITPHSAFYTRESLYDLRYKAADTLKKYFEKKILKNCVN